MKSLRVALCQIAVGTDKAANVASAAAAVARAAAQRGPEQPMLVVLGECWNSPYGTRFFPEYAEAVPEGPTTLAMRGWAREHGVWLVGGSIPERAPSGAAEALYNTCVVCDPAGSVVATHRKLHLFDVDVPGGIRFQESETLSPGAHVTTFDIHDAAANTFTVGVGICYDIRFAELAMLMARHHGARLLVYPSAFNMTTGPLHWDLLTRARAVDNQGQRGRGLTYLRWGGFSNSC